MRDKERDLRDEIRSHLDMAAADRVDRGATPDGAAAAARRELGNISQIQEATRDVWGRRWIGQAAQDIRYAFRIFWRSPGFALVAILSLTLGIGANTALFEVVNAVRLRALPIANPQDLVEVRLASMDGVRGNRQTWYPSVTQPIWREIQARQTALTGLFAWNRASFNLAEGGEARRSEGLWVSGEFFPTLGVRPVAGRLFNSEDDRPGCALRAVLSDGFWRRSYGGDPSAVGRTITLESRPFEIIGVAAPGFYGLEVGRAFDVALPLCAEPALDGDGDGRVNAGTTWWLSVFGRLKPGWTTDRAAAHFAAISPDLFRASLPAGYPPVSVQSYLDLKLTAKSGSAGLSQLREQYETPLWLLLGISGVVLVIACANLANLLLARASAREREIAIRLGIGASRGRVIRQLLTESLVLVAIGTAGALFVAGTLGQWLVTALETSDRTITLPLGIDWKVFGFACALALATCVLFGLAPAIRGTSVAAGAVMRGGARGTTSGRESRAIRRGLVIVQMALSLALLVASFLFARTLSNVLGVDPGFRAEGLTVAEINLTKLKLPADHVAVAVGDVIDRIRAIPGVESASTVAVVPISGSSGSNAVWPESDRSRSFESLINSAGSGFFSTMKVPMVAGRDFDQRDTPQSVPVAIVNETFAAKLGGNAAAIGQRFTRERTPRNPEKTYEIVGVVKNSSYMSVTEPPSPVACYADGQRSPEPDVQLVIRSSLPATTTTSAITAALANTDRRIEVSYVVLSTMIGDTLLQQKLLAALSGGFGALAAILTMVGLYGLVSYTVSRRTGEIGIRMALGATARDVVKLFLIEIGVLLAIGTACGLGLALAGGPTAAALLFRVEPYDPAILAAAVALLGTIALLASIVPARRATRIEPVVALRAE
jgi:predicted permease